jgi:hypothetical protein
MKVQPVLRTCFVAVLAFLYGVWSPAPCPAQKPPPPANPQAPTINPLMPVGLERGKSAEIVLTGTGLASPTGIALGFPAKATIPTEDKNGSDATKCKVRIDVPANTPIGWYAFRYATLKGVSNLRVVCVDELPQHTSNAANRSKAMAQAISVPGAVTGAVIAEQGDFYKITVKAGERLSFDCQARRIGSAIDACMYLYDAKSMRELKYDNDSPGCQTDPRISYTFKEAGEYLIEIKDVLHRGGPEFFYRLRIGDFPMATTPMPLAAKRGTKAKVAFAGPAIEGVAPVEVAVPTDSATNVLWVAPKGASGLSGWPVALAVSDHEEATEQEPNDAAKSANRIAIPGGVSGRFQRSDDPEFYLFSGKKGQKLTVEAQTLELSSPSLLLLSVRNAKTGAEVAKSNPQAPPPGDQRFDVAVPEDGDYVLEVQHLHFAGGASETYRVIVRPASIGFDVNLPSERFDIAPSGTAAIPVQIVRRGYTGAIELSTRGHSSLSGTATLKAGQNAGVLMVISKGDLPMGAHQFQVVAKATIDGKEHEQIASAKGMIVQSMNGLLYPPLHLQTFVALAVKEKAPFTLAIRMDPPQAIPGGKANVIVTATREPGFDEEITFSLPTGLPPTVPAPKTIAAIAKGKTETSFPLDFNAKTPLGESFVFLSAKTKHQGKEYSAAPPPLLLVLGAPFELKVEPATVSLKAGEKVKLKVTADRKGGYKGPITLDVRKLPAMVTAGKAAIAQDQTSAEIEIVAAPTATPAETAGVDVAGTATALNNVVNASPPFVVRVQKK